ncbi:MAG: RES family NAD+ phosphorylase [Cyclobacteriaceae bacterium]
MIVYRIVAEKYAGQLLASGRPGRWNYQDQFVIYTSESRSLASLELLVNLSGIALSKKFKVLEIEIPDDFDSIHINDIPSSWRTLDFYPKTQMIGANWYQLLNQPILKVPSAVIPREHNYIINTKHKAFSSVQIKTVEDYFWDSRLLTV